MSFARWNRLPGLAVGLLALACGGDGGGGGTGPPGPPAQLAKSGGDAQAWYFNSPLPNPYSVTVRDANNRTVPGVSVDWAITTGLPSTLSADPSTTNSSGVATTVHTLGTASTYVVTASVTGVQTSVTFTATAAPAPTSRAVNVEDNRFSPANVEIGTSGTVTWTWSGTQVHNVTIGGPTPRPPDSGNKTTGTHQGTFTTVGTYGYTCTNHAGMNGTVTVVN